MKRVFQKITGIMLIMKKILFTVLVSALLGNHCLAFAYNENETQYRSDAASLLSFMEIIYGYNNTLGLNDYVTREQIAVFINRVCQYDDKITDLHFEDGYMVSNWAIDSVNKCVVHNIIHGYEDNTFRPKDYVTTAEAVKMLSIALKGQHNLAYPDGYMKYANNNGLLFAIDNERDDLMTRGDVVTLIYSGTIEKMSEATER